jgi:hypothetical protein
MKRSMAAVGSGIFFLLLIYAIVILTAPVDAEQCRQFVSVR